MAKFNSFMLETCCVLRSSGLSQTAIAKNLGINRRTLYDWIQRGKNAKSGKYKRFYDMWLDAEEQYLIANPPKNTYKRKYVQKRNMNYPKGYDRFRKDVLTRDGYSCVCCGYDDNLEVHHIYGATEHPDLITDVDNGVTLCKYCHQKYHHIYSRYGINATDFNEFMNNFRVIR